MSLSKDNKSAEEGSQLSKALGTAGEAVLASAALIVLGAWSGMWLDKQLHTQPLLTLLLAILGMFLGLARMVKKALDMDRLENRPADRSRQSGSPNHKEESKGDERLNRQE